MADPRFRDASEPRDSDFRTTERSGYNGRYNYSSAAEYEAAGDTQGPRGRDRNTADRSYGSGNYAGNSYDGGGNQSGGMGWRGDDYRGDRSQSGFGRSYGDDRGYDRSAYGAGGGFRDNGRNDYGRNDYGRGSDNRNDRGFFDRAGDEVRSWFGDEEAERRRELDARESDHHYHNWRSQQIADFDRDYDEYRRENSQKFASEFGSWRNERQGQRGALQRVTAHMEVVGSDGAHVGTVDKVRGDRILLTKSDPDAGGHHHSIPSRWIETVDDKVAIRKTAEEAKSHWRDEERSGALFGQDDSSPDKRAKSPGTFQGS